MKAKFHGQNFHPSHGTITLDANGFLLGLKRRIEKEKEERNKEK